MKPKMDFAFGEDFQCQMLAYMLQDLTFTKNVLKYIPEERLYSEAHKYLYGEIKKKFEENNEVLTYIEVEDRLKTVERHKRRMLKTFCKKIFKTRAENPDFLREKLTEYAKKNAFIDIFMTGQTFWNSKEYENAYLYTMEGINQLYSIDFADDAIIPIEEFEERRNLYIGELAKSARRTPTNIVALDEILRGGLEKGELAIALAEPKKGKSICLTHMGCAAITTRSGRVAHFVLEGTTEQSILRYLSRLSGIHYRRLEKDELTEREQARLDLIEKKFMGNLDIIPMNKHWNYTVMDIEAKIRELEQQGKKPDLIVVDYADLLKAPEKLEKRHEQTEVYRDLKRLAIIKKVAIWTASQATRPKDQPDKEYLLRSKDISESYEKVRIADLVITLNQTPREKENGLLRFHLDIYRSNEADKTITLLVDFERMIFHNRKYGAANFDMDLNFAWMSKKRGRR